MVKESNEKVSEKPACTSPLIRARSKTINTLITKIAATLLTGSDCIVILNPDLLYKPEQPFLVLEADLRRNQNYMDKYLSNVIGLYDRVDQGMLVEDIKAIFYSKIDIQFSSNK